MLARKKRNVHYGDDDDDVAGVIDKTNKWPWRGLHEYIMNNVNPPTAYSSYVSVARRPLWPALFGSLSRNDDAVHMPTSLPASFLQE